MYIFRLTLIFLLLPVLAVQALWVVVKAQRLPEPDGPRKGQIGDGPLLRLWIIGDSSAAGVGVQDQRDAMAGQITSTLATDFAVDWTLTAQTGATTTDGVRWVRNAERKQIDVAAIIFGVNDAKNGVLRKTWRRNLHTLIKTLREEFGSRHIVFMAMPPVDLFPLLPNPLRWALSIRAKALNADLALVAEQSGASVVQPNHPTDDPTVMAPDGFHPGPEIYRICGQDLAQDIKAASERS